ncbi:MAG: GNAT family N-acetyltransferase [Curvibacter sp.]|nr:GNAT family N-acetyltransferase [Curvibacter sp.]
MNTAPHRLQEVASEEELSACFDLMRQLRPHLADSQELRARWRLQQSEGYRLWALFEAGRPVALAGFRVQNNLVHGRFLYVDDLVTDQSLRSAGHGARLMAELKQEAARLACAKLVLDTPLANALGQRFYFRQGLLASALRFNTPIAA